ncbi:MAG: hypothetical protein IJJ14_00205 [Coriobacteriales bacterium]|nr:hypothetical protein [Coriobacteriales bacterium]
MEFIQQLAQDRFNSFRSFMEDIQQVEVMARMENARQTIPILPALNARPDVAVIAEFKRVDPILGDLADDEDHVPFAQAAERGGAAMVAACIEPSEFYGAYEDLHDLSQAVNIPVICDDFKINEHQFIIDRACGADASIIHMAITSNCCGAFVDMAPRLGITPLVEVRNMEEYRMALDNGAPAIIVSATDLDTEVTDLDAILPVVRAAKAYGKLVFVKDGIETREDVEKVAAAGADAVIVSAPLLQSDDVEAAVRALTGVPRRKATRRTMIKIDGINNVEDAALLLKMDVDAMGISFIEGDPYAVSSNEQAAEIVKLLPRRVASCGMFKNSGRVAIERAIREVGFLYSEYCGDEPPALARRSDNNVIPHFRIDTQIPLDRMRLYGMKLAFSILEPQEGQETLDWEGIGLLPAKGRYYISGGLTVDNVEQAMAAMHPDGVVFKADVDLESGRKDFAPVQAFIDAVRAADARLYGTKA